MRVSVIGAGLAGCEAAHQLAKFGISVDLVEMKPQKYTPAHHYPGFAELVCSNSLKASRPDSAAGMLKQEMRLFGSLVMESAEQCSVAAGGALAVDRKKFSDYITRRIRENPLIRVIEQELDQVPEGEVIIASGPLTSEPLAQAIQRLVESEGLSFFDAAAPIVSAVSVNREIVFSASRYGEGEEGDYLNCPMNREEYEQFYQALVEAESVPLKDFDRRDFKVYEGCMPIEVMAKRGPDTIRFGPLKPVGLRDPRTGHRPWACVQLRRENAEGSLYNLQHGGLPDSSAFPGAEAGIFADPRAGIGRVPALWGHAPQYFFGQPPAVGCPFLSSCGTQDPFCRTDYRGRGLCGVYCVGLSGGCGIGA